MQRLWASLMASQLGFIKSLPPTIKALCHIPGVWLVGSTAIPGAFGTKDIDLLVEPQDWDRVSLWLAGLSSSKELLATEINRFGGFKLTFVDFELDIWPQSLGSFLGLGPEKAFVFNLCSCRRYCIEGASAEQAAKATSATLASFPIGVNGQE